MFYRAAVLICLLFIAPGKISAQPAPIKELEQKVYQYNNRFFYDSSRLLLGNYLQQPNLSAEEKYYSYLYLSYTFKRLFDYSNTLKYLDSALYFGKQTSNPSFYFNNIAAQKAFSLFDIHEYSQADSLMRYLRTENYQYLDEEIQAKVMMQEAYLLYQQKQYPQAAEKYRIALAKIQASSPCDQPMILVKQVELYGAMGADNLLMDAYKQAGRIADSCGIIKYHLYANEIMAEVMGRQGKYQQALYYVQVKDSLEKIYNSNLHRNKLLELEAEHQNQIKENQIALQTKSLQSKNLLILLLILSLIAVGALIMYYTQRSKQARMEQMKKNTERFTLQLLQKSEADRSRIAGHLHDSINHELLNLKTMSAGHADLQQRIDVLIEEVRHISHNLHPVVFYRVGLKHSILQLVERVQVKNNFMLSAEINYQGELAPEAELQLFRIVQEAVTNMVKHASAVAGKITVESQQQKIWVEIKDNGTGFDVEAMLNSDKAFGLHNIIERSKAAGGEAFIQSDKKGTFIEINIPKSA